MSPWHRARPLLAIIALVLAIVPPRLVAGDDDSARLVAFAAQIGLADVEGFVATVTSLRHYGRLQPHYVSKRQAEQLGWRPGRDLCRAAPGRALGGDRFYDREQRLPAADGRRWSEADLDSACGRRGPRRLIWSTDGLILVTLDHYRTFVEVP